METCQVNDLFYLQRSRIGDHDVAFDRGEVDVVTLGDAVMQALDPDFDAPLWRGEAQRVLLFESGDPQLTRGEEHVVGMRGVRLCAGDLAIVHVSRETVPDAATQ